MNTIDQTNWKGKKALIRVDLNVPMNGQNRIQDYTRIEGTMPTIEHILEQDGAVILMSHMGRPEGKYDEALSLKHLVPELEKRLNREVKFAPDCIGKEAQDLARHLKNGEVLLLENLRFHREEQEANPQFAAALASLGDEYVNDAFGASHRVHASVTEVPKYFHEKFAGELIDFELEKIDLLLQKPKEPVTIVLGGSKITDKIEMIDALLDKASHILIGGAMAYTFIKAQEREVGDSAVEEDKLKDARWLLNKAKRNKTTIVLPEDSVVTGDISGTVETKVADSGNIEKGMKGCDIGPKARETFSQIIAQSGTVIWNGPMGIFEKEGCEEGTKVIAQAIADATDRDAYTMVGGGDTTSAVTKFFLQGSYWHISTGGGALLAYLKARALPGLHALDVSKDFVF